MSRPLIETVDSPRADGILFTSGAMSFSSLRLTIRWSSVME
jgi:hypothetical protein